MPAIRSNNPRLSRVQVLIILYATLLSSQSSDAFAFLPNIAPCSGDSQRLRNVCRLSPSKSTQEDTSYDLELPPIDVRLFLTQRCIQSFMFLLASIRDVHTLKWLDDFTQPVVPHDDIDKTENSYSDGEESELPTWVDNDKKLNSRLLQYHGTGAMNTTRFPTWKSYFEDLVQLPCKTLTIQPNNLIASHTSISEFNIDIEPPRLCARLVSVREQIAKEWTRDLDAIGSVGFDIYYSYWENVKKRQLEAQNAGVDDTRPDVEEQAFERQSKLFLDYDPLFDAEFAPSPFRKGNFDLLYNLATQESIHRVLRQGISVEQDEDGVASTAFLEQFYKERTQSHFNDDLRYGRADDFLEELMLCMPQIVTPVASSSSDMIIVNPVTIAEIVLKMREKVTDDWKEIMRNIPDEHMEIRKLMLSRMMT